MKEQKQDEFVFFINEYLYETIHFSKSDHGAYLLAMCAYWKNQGALDDDIFKKILSEENFKTVSKFFEYRSGKWYHEKIDDQINQINKTKDKLKERGQKAAFSRWKIKQREEETKIDLELIEKPDLQIKQYTTKDMEQIQKRRDINYKTEPKKNHVEKPADVSRATWDEFLELRRKKRATITPTVLNTFKSEAEKAGISLEEALKTCIFRGWIAFKSNWIRENKNVRSQNVQETISRNSEAIKKHFKL